MKVTRVAGPKGPYRTIVPPHGNLFTKKYNIMGIYKSYRNFLQLEFIWTSSGIACKLLLKFVKFC